MFQTIRSDLNNRCVGSVIFLQSRVRIDVHLHEAVGEFFVQGQEIGFRRAAMLVVFAEVECDSDHDMKFLQTKIDPEELTRRGNAFEDAGKQHHTDDDEDDAHGYFHVAHDLAVFSQGE